MRKLALISVALALPLASCGGEVAGDEPLPEGEADGFAWPVSVAAFGDGYPAAGDPCMRLGESAATSNYLDDSAVLVGCPTAVQAGALGGEIVAEIDGVTVVSVSMGDANVGMSENGPPPPEAAAAAPTSRAVAIRGPNSLETRCADRVAAETGARVIGTNRIEESEAAIAIYVNVDGAAAPWRCLAYRDGTIGEVMFASSEGDL
ncbi:hypothetical protein OZN62_08395 [Aurantiacibacter sp. MUD11]|uniref:hypothetical protein n=1 Tax=Aurantiacibacter sp. MUD11 TaxID=3003265 RepID=UPI0022AABB47|nr:hypothetical protein [Aurantiacibacter sp. MUD11]WAT16959.1 hypothetical protein OZN62_08395 [Aurantiacibacter sp. MUD11]